MKIGNRVIGDSHQTYFIADISANHDGQLDRARELIHLAARAGADAAKFQNFRASKIVSDRGFRSLTTHGSHQATWRKSVFEVYEAASLPWDWTSELSRCCKDAGIDYMSTPYDLEAVEMLSPHVPAFKIGSGDITWPEMLQKVAQQGKPVLLATGASTLDEVRLAVNTVEESNSQICIMQCNTNYTASRDNFKHIHLRVLNTFRNEFPRLVLGLSDHTSGHATVLGAVSLGARVIEKHFTDDTTREGPDHPFSMTPTTWREMVDRTRELELALGDSAKVVADNEQDTVIVQRRCLRAARPLPAGTILRAEDVEVLRPAPRDAITPVDLARIVGSTLKRSIELGDPLTWDLLGPSPQTT